MEEVLRRVLSKPMFSWVGLIAFFGLALSRWKVMLQLAPMLALGLLSFQSSNRFIMYLAPFIGIGLGWILSLGIEAVFYFGLLKHSKGTGKKRLSAKNAKDVNLKKKAQRR